MGTKDSKKTIDFVEKYVKKKETDAGSVYHSTL